MLINSRAPYGQCWWQRRSRIQPTWYMPGRLARPPRSRRPEPPAAFEKGEPLVVTVPPGPFVTLGELTFLPLPAAGDARLSMLWSSLRTQLNHISLPHSQGFCSVAVQVGSGT